MIRPRESKTEKEGNTMPTFKIEAKRQTCYELEIEADSKEEAIKEMKRRETAEEIEDYAYEWFPLEVVEIREEE